MTKKEFPDWQELYKEKDVSEMPWFYKNLDPDFEEALKLYGLESGSFLDLGTGPATQALEMARRNFSVSGVDLSQAAIDLAQEKAQSENLTIDFFQDDILNSKLHLKFDIILDRGCFHCLDPDDREAYVSKLFSLMKDKSFFFLKCFSYKESREEGPYRFSPEEISQIFSNKFSIRSIKETVYQGTLENYPKALFSILQANTL